MGGWQEHRLNQKETLNVCVQWSLMRFRVGLGTRMKGLKDPCLKSKGEEFKFQPNTFSDFSLLHTEFNLISV